MPVLELSDAPAPRRTASITHSNACPKGQPVHYQLLAPPSTNPEELFDYKLQRGSVISALPARQLSKNDTT